MIKAKKRHSLLLKTGLLAGALGLCFIASCKAPQPLIDQGPDSFAALYNADHGSFRDGFFIFSVPGKRDYIAINSDFSQLDDVLIGLDLSDFMQAGFDPQSLKTEEFKSVFIVYDLPTSSMVLSCHLSDTSFKHTGYVDKQGSPITEPNPTTLYSEMLRTNPQRISYDPTDKVFSMNFDNGFAMEWPLLPIGSTQKVSFVLDPAPFVKAGLKIEQLKLWKAGTQIDKAADGSSISRACLRLYFSLP